MNHSKKIKKGDKDGTSCFYFVLSSSVDCPLLQYLHSHCSNGDN